MVERAIAVIGANFGDEGKGLMTDYLACQLGPGTAVVRFNGGAQAGHTVETPEGRRHAFGHVGAGAFAGALTLLSRYFIVNPILFQREADRLVRIGGVDRPRVFVEGAALVTTPYDMLLNQFAERQRGDGRHGSCGVGINETVERSMRAERFAIRERDLRSPSGLSNLDAVLDSIETDYVPGRAAELGLGAESVAELLVVGRRERRSFHNAVASFLCRTSEVQSDWLGRGPNVIFEGAQGLLLDQGHRFFPHVTRSRTGLWNVLALAAESGIRDLDVVYVTRAYMTRHGAGPFPSETADDGLIGKDRTNVTGPWQGGLRVGRLDLDLMKESIDNDLASAAGSGVRVRPMLAMTCLDQVQEDVSYFHQGAIRSARRAELFRIALDALGISSGFECYGPTRFDVRPRPSQNAGPGLAYPPTLTPELREALGHLCFQIIVEAEVYRAAGHKIAHRAADEQAFVLDRMVRAVIAGGPDWKRRFSNNLSAAIEQAKARQTEKT